MLQFDFKGCLSAGNRINSTNTTVGGYGASEMKMTTLPALVNALPDWLKTRLIEFSVLASAGNNSSTIETVSGNKLSLRSEIEIMGTSSNSFAGEGTAISYYTSSQANRDKIPWSVGPYYAWELRSPRKSDPERYVVVNEYGSGTGSSYATTAGGVSPFGCL